MPRIWYTADLHLGHANIIEYCKRPFGSVTEMDAALIENWNSCVAPGDQVWVVGDFAYGSAEVVGHYLRRLRGRKHLIHGNHDKSSVRELPEWTSSQPYKLARDGDRHAFLCHYAMRVWPGMRSDAAHLFGHSHGGIPADRRSCDVGVDCWNFRPVSLSEVQLYLQKQPERGSQG